MTKSRWKIENQGLNDAENHHCLGYIRHPVGNSLLAEWLIMVVALFIERLYRLRYLRRGLHALRSSIELLRCLRLALARPTPPETS